MRKQRSLPRLSKRLLMAAQMMSPCEVAADVGCDHAHLAIYLVRKGIAGRAVAMDVREGPLKFARENIALYECGGMIDIRLSDGLDALAAGEAQTIVMTGMGGVLTAELLERGRDRLEGVRELILSPQSHPELVRSFVLDAGFDIAEEDICIDGGKYYTAIRAVRPDAGISDRGTQGTPGDAGRGKVEAAAGTFAMPKELAEYIKKLAARSAREDDGAVQIDAILERSCSPDEEARLRYGDADMYAGKDLYLDFLLYEKKKVERVLGKLGESGQESAKEKARFSRRREVLLRAMECYGRAKPSNAGASSEDRRDSTLRIGEGYEL